MTKALSMKRILLIVLAVLLTAVVGLALLFHTPDLTREELEAKYGTDAGDYVEAAGMRVHVRVDGPADAPAVVMIHGFGASLQTWEPWAEALSGDYRVIRFDLPGFGLTGPDPTGDYSDERSLAVLDSLMAELGVDRASLVGNSLGGLIAWKYAAQHPEKVEKLVLLAPGGFANPGYSYGQRIEVPQAFKVMRYTLPESAVRQFMTPLYGDPAAMTDDLVARYHDMMRAPGVREAMVQRLEQFVVERPEPILRTIDTPTLIIWGERDVMVPFAHAAAFGEALPNDTLVSFPQLGHMPQEEAPDLVLQPVRAFLEQ